MKHAQILAGALLVVGSFLSGCGTRTGTEAPLGPDSSSPAVAASASTASIGVSDVSAIPVSGPVPNGCVRVAEAAIGTPTWTLYMPGRLVTFNKWLSQDGKVVGFHFVATGGPVGFAVTAGGQTFRGTSSPWSSPHDIDTLTFCPVVPAGTPNSSGTLATGAACEANASCRSGACVNGKCAVGGPGAKCVAPADCASNACAGGVCGGLVGDCPPGGACVDNAKCQSGVCFDNTCLPGGVGTPCKKLSDCASGVCSDGKCGAPPAGGAGGGGASLPVPGSPGAPCSAGNECASGICVNGQCGGTSGPGQAGTGAPCSGDSACRSGACVSGACAPGAPGAGCAGPVDCVSAMCVNGTCEGAGRGAPCASNSVCFSGSCVNALCEGAGNGGSCRNDGDCQTGSACQSGVCKSTIIIN